VLDLPVALLHHLALLLRQAPARVHPPVLVTHQVVDPLEDLLPRQAHLLVLDQAAALLRLQAAPLACRQQKLSVRK
jgi:hypothetical protein